MRICVIIPALNEGGCIGRLVASLPRPLMSEAIVVDNNSSDRTAAIARAAGATVLEQTQRGYGHACAAGAKGGGRCRAACIYGLRSERRSGRTAQRRRAHDKRRGPPVAGDTYPGGTGCAYPAADHRQPCDAGSDCATAAPAPAGPAMVQVVRRGVPQQLDLRERTYGWTTEPLVKAIKAHVRIVEAPTHYRKRGGGQSEVAGTLRDTLGAGYSILKVVLRYAR